MKPVADLRASGPHGCWAATGPVPTLDIAPGVGNASGGLRLRGRLRCSGRACGVQLSWLDAGGDEQALGPLPLRLDGRFDHLVQVAGRAVQLRLRFDAAAGEIDLQDVALVGIAGLSSWLLQVRCWLSLRWRHRHQWRHVRAVMRRHGWRNALPLASLLEPATAPIPYDDGSDRCWVAWHGRLTDQERRQLQRTVAAMPIRPMFCLRVTGAVDDLAAVAPLVESARRQLWPEWRLEIPGQALVHGPAASPPNPGWDEFVVPLPADAVLAEDLLAQFAAALNAHPQARLIYADEDRVGVDGRRADPVFKCAWNAELLATRDYIGYPHAVRATDWQGPGHAGLLDLTARCRPDAIWHVPRVLLHRRQGACAHPVASIVSPLPQPAPLVTVIIPTRDRADFLRRCLHGVLEGTRYPDLEVIVVDNGSREPATLDLLAGLPQSDPRVRVLREPGAFNFAALNNVAVRAARGSLLCLLNNDIEIIDPGWLAAMVAQALRPGIGCVGARLLYPDGSIQHAGIALGIRGGAGHVLRHRDPAAWPAGLHADAVREWLAVTAACLVVRRDIYQQVGGMDEDYAVAFNDVDFCLRVHAAGYRNLCTPQATLVHHESVSRGGPRTWAARWRHGRELGRLRRRWRGWIDADPCYSPALSLGREDCALAPAVRLPTDSAGLVQARSGLLPHDSAE